MDIGRVHTILMGFPRIDTATTGCGASVSETTLRLDCGHAALQGRRVLKTTFQMVRSGTCGCVLLEQVVRAESGSLLPARKGDNA
jgi:hypothetical protein